MINSKTPTLLNVSYIRPPRRGDDNALPESFEVIYKNENGNVFKTYESPDADIYVVKPEFRNYDYNKPQERIEKMKKIRVPISRIRYRIAEEMGEEGANIIKTAYQEKSFKLLDQLYKWRYCYGCDFQPEYYYMKNWYEKYNLGNVKLSKGFIDIECDMIDYQMDLDNIPDTAHSPVNVVTVITEDTKESYTFILNPHEPSRSGRSEEEYKERYKLYEQQLKSHQWLLSHKAEFIKGLHQRFDSTYGNLDYHIRNYEEEIDLIADVFGFINLRKPNFMLIWNMRFDIQYLYYRICALGYNPASIMCHDDFDNKRCSFKVDRSTFLLEKQYDYFYCSSYTQYICQMRLYASIRKSQHKLRSVKLNAIADYELKDKKVEYPAETNMMHFPYVDWIKFIIYNIKDVLLQVGIERKTNDTKTYYMRSHVNLTPYNKIFKETHLLRNVREKYFEKEGWVQGNNLNILDDNLVEEARRMFYGLDEEDDEDEATFKGAIMADPTWNAYVGLEISGEKSNNIFQNTIDYDMGAFYPSCKIASNMDPGTLLYKASFNNDEFMSGEFSNRSLNTQYVEKDKYGNIRRLDITGEAVNTYCSKNILSFGYNYLGYPDIDSIMREVYREKSRSA